EKLRQHECGDSIVFDDQDVTRLALHWQNQTLRCVMQTSQRHGVVGGSGASREYIVAASPTA
ncbi:MAG: hypothetical protein AB7L94_38080, partial [Kofleriaceae bacterium]